MDYKCELLNAIYRIYSNTIKPSLIIIKCEGQKNYFTYVSWEKKTINGDEEYQIYLDRTANMTLVEKSARNCTFNEFCDMIRVLYEKHGIPYNYEMQNIRYSHTIGYDFNKDKPSDLLCEIFKNKNVSNIQIKNYILELHRSNLIKELMISSRRDEDYTVYGITDIGIKYLGERNIFHNKLINNKLLILSFMISVIGGFIISLYKLFNSEIIYTIFINHLHI